MKKVGCGYVFVSLSRELIINKLLLVTACSSNFVPVFVVSVVVSNGLEGPPPEIGGFFPGTSNNDSSEI